MPFERLPADGEFEQLNSDILRCPLIANQCKHTEGCLIKGTMTIGQTLKTRESRPSSFLSMPPSGCEPQSLHISITEIVRFKCTICYERNFSVAQQTFLHVLSSNTLHARPLLCTAKQVGESPVVYVLFYRITCLNQHL